MGKSTFEDRLSEIAKTYRVCCARRVFTDVMSVMTKECIQKIQARLQVQTTRYIIPSKYYVFKWTLVKDDGQGHLVYRCDTDYAKIKLSYGVMYNVANNITEYWHMTLNYANKTLSITEVSDEC